MSGPASVRVKARLLFAFFLLLGVAFSGCAGGGATEAGHAIRGAAEPEFGDDTGALAGLVITEEFAPIVNATVAVDGTDLLAATGDDGRFTFSHVAPGTYKIIALALGYESVALGVDVAPGVVTEVRITLGKLAVVEPYVELIIGRGYAVCDINAVFIILQAPSTLPGCTQLKGQFPVDVKDTWRYGVFEADWRSADALHFFADTDGTCLFGTSSTNPCYEWKTGRSPLRLDALPNTTWHLAPPTFRYPPGAFRLIINGGGAGLLQKEISDSIVCRTGRPNGPECGGVGFGLGFAYNVYISIFHNEAPANPKIYSAIPDR